MANIEEIIEEIIVYEDYSGEEDGEWLIDEDGNYYMVVEEYEEYELSDDSNNDNNKKIEPIVRNRRSSSLADFPQNLRTGTSCLISPKIPRENKKSRKEKEKEKPIEKPIKPVKKKTTRKLKKKKKKLQSPKISPKNKKRLSSNEATLKQANSSPLSRFKAKQQAAKNRSIFSSKMELLRQKNRNERIFGEDLEVLVEREIKQGKTIKNQPKSVPGVVFYLVEYIRSRGLNMSGLFRECGHHATQLRLEGEIENGIPFGYLSLDKESIHTVSDLLKSYLRQLPQPVIPRTPYCSLLIQESNISDNNVKIELFKVIIKSLPIIRYECLSYLVQFMLDISIYNHENLMDTKNVAKIFASLILGNIENDNKKLSLDPMILFMETEEITQITMLLIENYKYIFSGSPEPLKIYTVTEPFNPTSKAYMPVLPGDIVIYLHETDSGVLVVVDQIFGEIPKSVIEYNMKPTKLSNLETASVNEVLQRKKNTRTGKPKSSSSFNLSRK